MFCSECGGDTHVTDTDRSNPSYVRRRRECLTCGARFTTYERIRPDLRERRRKSRDSV